MILFFICIFLMQETEDPCDSKKPRSPAPSTKKLSKSSSGSRLHGNSKNNNSKGPSSSSPSTSPFACDARLPNLPFPDENTSLLDDLRRQEGELKRQEAEAWQRQEEAVRTEKENLLRREDELRARFERMEALHPKPALYIQSSSPVAFTTMPRSAPLYESYAARDAREKRQALEATEQATVQSPSLADRPLGMTAPPVTGTPGTTSSFGEPRAFQTRVEKYEARRDFAGGSGSLMASPVPGAAPAPSNSFEGFSASSALPAATAPALTEEELTPEQKLTLQNIMQQTGASREATLRAMKRARAEEEQILRELELKRQRAAATATGP